MTTRYPNTLALLVLGAFIGFLVVSTIGDTPRNCSEPFSLWDTTKALGFFAALMVTAWSAGREYERNQPKE